MKMPLASRNDHQSRSGRVDLTSVARRRDLIVTTMMRTRVLSEVQNLSVAEKPVASQWEDLNPLEVDPRLPTTAIIVGLITPLRDGRSKINAGSVSDKEDMKAGKEVQTSIDIKAVGGVINFGDRALALASAEITEQG